MPPRNAIPFSRTIQRMDCVCRLPAGERPAVHDQRGLRLDPRRQHRVGGSGIFRLRITSVLVEKGYSRIRGADPIIRAKFDVYLVENHLIYFKTPCAPSDKRETFFLQVVPTDVNALPEGLPRKRGFEHRDYHVSVRLDATHAGGRCMAVVPLPDYDVAGIRTGQYTRNGLTWKEAFSFIEGSSAEFVGRK